MDIADSAQAAIDQSLAHALAVAKLTGKEQLTGFCKNCNDATAGIFCSKECREDDTKRERMKG